MYANIKSKIHEEKSFSRKFRLADVKRRYVGFTVEETEGGFLLQAPATLTKYGAYDTTDRPATFQLNLPDRQLVIDGKRHWPFEGVQTTKTKDMVPAYHEIATKIALRAFRSEDVPDRHYGIIPGDFRFDGVGNPIFTIAKKRSEAYFLLFYGDCPLHGFAGSQRYNMVSVDGIWMAFIPIALADQILAGRS